jgi:hypothetical protein
MTRRIGFLALSLALWLLPSGEARAASALSVQITNGYNLIVDSNVTSPPTYAPSAAYIGARICNTGVAGVDPAIDDVFAYTGNYNGGVSPTPGVFPSRTFVGGDPQTQLIGTGSYALKLEAGTTGAADANRYIGTLAAGQCHTEYWLFSYPQCVNVGGAQQYPPCTASITGDVKPTDDPVLHYDVWVEAPSATTMSSRRSFTMRNEISAAANKIWPNNAAKVPDEYLTAIASVVGWGTIGPDGQPITVTHPVLPGERVITTQGIWYDLGNVGQGFDNDGDLVPDQNAWLQPVGDPGKFDASCFRLVNVYGVVIVKLKTGGELLIPFLNELYFQNIPDNTGVVGLVFYQFIATNEGCSAAMTPYQEAASGFDNEKFSSDYGLDNPLYSGSFGASIDFRKSDGVKQTASNGSLTYTITAANRTGITSPCPSLSAACGVHLGAPDLGTPLVFREKVPTGATLTAIGPVTVPNATPGNAARLGSYTRGYTDRDGNIDYCQIDYETTTSSYKILYSTDGGATWSLTQPTLSAVTDIEWMLLATIALDGGHDGTQCIAPDGVFNNNQGLLGGSPVYVREGTAQTSLPGTTDANNLKSFSAQFSVSLSPATVGPVHCNTATLQFGPAASRTGSADGRYLQVTTNGTATVAGAFVANDVGLGITGTGIPSGASITAVNAGVSATISAAATGSGTITANLSGSECDIVTGPNALSGTVFEDDGGTTAANYGNGVKNDATEVGIGSGATGSGTGVTVSLYYDVDANGKYSTGDLLYGTARTAADGTYSFSNLPDGLYVVSVNKYDGTVDGNAATEFLGSRATNADNTAGWGNTTYNPNLPVSTASPNGKLAMSETINSVALAVALDANRDNGTGESVTGVDFGFAPPFRLTKTVVGNPDANADGVADTAFDEGALYTYQITVENRLPSVGRQTPAGCEYVSWTTAGATSGQSNKDFTSPANAWDSTSPNGTVATASVTGGSLRWTLGNGFNLAPHSGTITKVEGLYFGYFNVALTDDYLNLLVGLTATTWDNGGLQTTCPVSGQCTISTSQIDSYVGTPSDFDPNNAIPWNITSLRPGGGTWSWADFAGLKLQVNPSKTANADAKVFSLDAIGIRVTTNAACEASPSTTLDPVPLLDTFDKDRIEFISADPAPTSVDTASGLIRWDDVGPLLPGTSRQVFVTARARDVNGTQAGACNTSFTGSGLPAFPWDGTTHENCNYVQTNFTAGATTYNVKYSDGRLANDDQDQRAISVVGKAELRGVVYNDVAPADFNTGMTLSGGNLPLPGVTVTLFACMTSAGTLETSTASNKTCLSAANGNSWAKLRTAVTSSNGAYEFIGLSTGTYIVEVGDTDNAPATGNTPPFNGTQTAEGLDAQTVTGLNANGQFGNPCATCNNTWGNPTLTLNNFNQLDQATEETIEGVNFGYNNIVALYGRVWHDVDGDAVYPPEPGELGLSSFTVTLYRDNGSTPGVYDSTDTLVATTTTDANGDYRFTGLLASTAYVVVVTPPMLRNKAWVETYETTGTTTSLNNQLPVTTPSSGPTGSHDFGYTKKDTASIGDTLFIDANANGFQDLNPDGSPKEPGIPNVTVWLYRDVDRDGAIDTGADALVATTSTDGNGKYLFSNLAAGSYVVKVDTSDAQFPLNVVATTDPDVSTGRIGDSVYFDANADGLPSRSFACTMNGTTTITGASFLATDVGTAISGTGIPAGARIVSVVAGVSAVISAAATGGTSCTVNDAGIRNVVVVLYEDSNNNGALNIGTDKLVAATLTDASGGYLFTGLHAGSYFVDVADDATDANGFTLPSASLSRVGADVRNTLITLATNSSVVLSADQGYSPSTDYAMGGRVWHDADGDGVLDAGEPGIPNVVVDVARNVTGCSYSNNSTSITCAANSFTAADVGRPISGLNIPAGATIAAVNSATNVTISASTSGSGSNQTLLVTLYSPTTDAGGQWISAGLVSGTAYTATVRTSTLPRGSVPTPTPGGGSSARVFTPATVDYMTADLGYRYDTNGNTTSWDAGDPTGTIDGRVFLDANGDGAWQSGEEKAGTTVNLLDENGYIIATTTTDSAGTYYFGGSSTCNLSTTTKCSAISVGEYSVQAVDTLGTRYSSVFVSASSSYSNVDVVYTSTIETTPDAQSSVAVDGIHADLMQDFGYRTLFGSIGDTIYWDSNRNGTQDLAEPGIAGVGVTLYTCGWYDANADGYLAYAVSGGEQRSCTQVQTTTTASDNPLTATTNEAGTYLFSNLPSVGRSLGGCTTTSGSATVTCPSGLFTSGDTGSKIWGEGIPDGATVTYASPTTVTLSAAATATGTTRLYLGLYYLVLVNAGSTPLAGATLTADPDADGAPCPSFSPSSACDSAQLASAFRAGSSYLGADFGYDLPPSATNAFIGDKVWIDQNGNGSADSGERGIPNVRVYLDANSNGTLDWTDANANGRWDSGEGERWVYTDFDGNYLLSGLSAGTSYTVRVDTATNWPTSLPTTPVYEAATASYDNSVSVALNASGQATITGSACAANCNLTVDFGYRYTGTNTLAGTICIDDGSKNGYCNASATGITVGTTLLSNIVTSAGLFAASDVGRSLSADGIPAGATITGFTDASHVTISANATATASPTATLGGVTTGETALGGIQVNLYLWNDSGATPNVAWAADGTLDSGDTFIPVASTSTNANGDYSFANVPTGKIVVTMSLAASQNLRLTTATAGSSVEGGAPAVTTQAIYDGTMTVGAYTVTVMTRQALTIGSGATRDLDFAFDPTLNGTLRYDLGDLPSSYGYTLLRNNGARHRMVDTGGTSIFLGAGITDELDGKEDVNAAGDTDDGVSLVGELTVGASGGMVEIAMGGSATSGWVEGWMDFDGDGTFTGEGEHILSTPVTPGVQRRLFDVPSTWTPPAPLSSKNVFARFRIFPDRPALSSFLGDALSISLQSGLSADGSTLAAPGEVEDYGFVVTAAATQAVVRYCVARNRGGNVAIEWETSAEVGTLGYFLQRWDAEKQQWLQVNQKMLPALIHTRQGGRYSYIDRDARPGVTYHYTLREIEITGEQRAYGPYAVNTTSTFQADLAAPVADGLQPVHGPSGFVKVAHGRPPAQKGVTRKAGVPARHGTVQTVKMTVGETGLYYVSLNDFTTLGGLPKDRSWLVSARSPYGMSEGGAAVAFAPAWDMNGIYFFGRAIDSPFARDNVYWLGATPQGGVRMTSRKERAAVAPRGTETFTRSVHVEQDLMPMLSWFENADSDYWMWAALWDGFGPEWATFSTTFRADGAARSGRATVRVRLKGGDDSEPGPDDHRATIRVNGYDIGDVTWSGLDEVEPTLTFNGSLLNDGENTLEVIGDGERAAWSLFFVDAFDVRYQSLYRATDDRLEFSANGNPSVFVSGFTSRDIMVFDVSDPRLPVYIDGSVGKTPDGRYGITLAPPRPTTRYYAVTPGALRAVGEIIPDAASSLASADNKGEYLIITTAELKATAQKLADYRSDLASQVIDIEDIYDEFGYGVPSPYAVKAFLRYARSTWTEPPRYVVLAGNGSFDYKDILGYGGNLVPPMVVSTPHWLFPSDTWFGDVDPAGPAPEIAIGRLPAANAAELDQLIRKVQLREAASGSPWMGQTLVAADNPDEAGDFTAGSERIAAIAAATSQVERIYLGSMGIAEARTRLIDGINAGAGAVSFVGHGGYDTFTDEGLLTQADVDGLVNLDKPTVLTALTCIGADFSWPGYPSLGDLLVRKAEGGAVAVWAPTGLSKNDAAVALGERYYAAAFGSDRVRIGDAIKRSMKAYEQAGLPAYMLSIYTLLGDPAMWVR